MALGLLDTLFYGSEPLDRLPKLLSKWAPSTTTREYLCNNNNELFKGLLHFLAQSGAENTA
jgi:hypothetical protein